MQGAIMDFEILRVSNGYAIPIQWSWVEKNGERWQSEFSISPNVKFVADNTGNFVPVSQNLLDFPKTEEINIWDIKKILEKNDYGEGLGRQQG